MNRFRDTGERIYSFIDEFLVECPNCQSRAILRCLFPDNLSGFAPYRFSCLACGRSKDWCDETTQGGHAAHVCDYLSSNYSLWLQIPCCSETLWAYNFRHLDFIEEFVGSGLRERVRSDLYGWSNRSLSSRLPKWMKSHKNRDDILKAIAKIRQKI